MIESAPRPVPSLEGRMAPFWKAAATGTFVVQRCRSCGLHRFPAFEFCSACLSVDLEWTPASGRGEVFSFVVVHHTLDAFFAARAPYVVADVKLSEGPHVTTTVVDCPPSELRIGDRVAVEFEQAAQDIWLPVFRRIET